VDTTGHGRQTEPSARKPTRVNGYKQVLAILEQPHWVEIRYSNINDSCDRILWVGEVDPLRFSHPPVKVLFLGDG
jgi:hypothetical protein